MDINIRRETKNDYMRVEGIARDCFWNLYVPGCDEHFLIHKMRKHKDFIKNLTLVLEVDGQVEGAIFYTRSKIIAPNKQEYKTITFGPVFIFPSFQRKGLGKRLITHSINIVKKKGYRAILILGYPYHYEPYGFVGGKAYNITMLDGKYYKCLQVLPLYKDAFKSISGCVHFSDVFEVDSDGLESYDKQFAPKEKKIEASQEKFALYSSLLDE